ncbi:mitochondrial escape protein 2 [Tieghemiomyces parasiticus]|uniref:Mitochondrial escape protein 2 n=1 Tax=Tieghemiomyces parasiticus TaxID=78921 RepID=A0A9W7ZPK3_9FUNG|nr:mitochondrial escape protein 2 [Tieghemiomyces parasiticus]
MFPVLRTTRPHGRCGSISPGPLVWRRRWARSASSTAAGANSEKSPDPVENTEASQNLSWPELTVYFDNVYPIKFGRFDFRSYLFLRSQPGLRSHIRNSLIPNDLPCGLEISSTTPRLKEGGLLARFRYRPDSPEITQAHIDVNELNAKLDGKIQEHLTARIARNWFNLQKTRSFRVRGHPFSEDMINWYPSSRLRVEFYGPDVSIERLYREFRPFGRIYDITIQAPTVKDMPRYAVIQYTRIRSAASARNCLHGVILDDTEIRLAYERVMRKKYILDWLTSHPRLVLPLLAGAFIAVVYAVFDPVRIFFIESRILQRFNPENYPIYRWLSRQTLSRIFRDPHAADDQRMEIWSERQQDRARLDKWLHEVPETFILVQGPHGTGKSEIVRQVTKDRPYQIVIQADELARARNEHEMLVILAKQVGYRPVFSFMQNATNLMDMAITATTGQKAGLSASVESQINKVLECVAVAIHEVREEVQKEHREAAATAARPPSWAERLGAIFTGPPDDKSAAKTAAGSAVNTKPLVGSSELAYHPEETPLIVINGFMNRDVEGHQRMLWDTLAKWAALLAENQAAHVVFVSSNVAASRALSRSLPHKSVNNLFLTDASPESAVRVLKLEFGLAQPPNATDHTEEPAKDKQSAREKASDQQEYASLVGQLERAVDCLGGRLTDLELLIRKVKGGQPIDEAVDDIVAKAAAEIRKFALSEKDGSDDAVTVGAAAAANGGASPGPSITKIRWTPVQFWALMEALATDEQVNYYRVLSSPLFNGDDQPLLAMEFGDLINVVQENGRPAYIRPARPVLTAAFRRILQDRVYASTMKIKTNKLLIDQQTAYIRKYEDELQRLEGMAGFKGIPTPPSQQAGLKRQRGWAVDQLVPRFVWPSWWLSWVVPSLYDADDSSITNAQVPEQLGSRVGWLLAKLAKAHQTTETLEVENTELQKLINSS